VTRVTVPAFSNYDSIAVYVKGTKQNQAVQRISEGLAQACEFSFSIQLLRCKKLRIPVLQRGKMVASAQEATQPGVGD